MNILLLELATICLYRDLLEDHAVKNLTALLGMMDQSNGSVEKMVKAYCQIHSKLLAENGTDFSEYISKRIYHDENLFTLSCEKGCPSESITQQAHRDILVLGKLAMLCCMDIKRRMKECASGNEEACGLIDSLPDWNNKSDRFPPVENFERLAPWYRKNGAGMFSEHVFFIWNGDKKKLVPVKNPDPITLDRLYLVESQKQTVRQNTESFLEGREANNILFYGDRGTGKSSMVKAVANAFSNRGLRLVEVPKKYLDQIPIITAMLSNRGLRFILFIDDLAFENNEEKYTALKAVLEGGLEYKPSNILLYATSNRRHIIKEKFSDRKGLGSDNSDDEVRARDSMQEKLSLADRFGITIVFSSPVKKEYLQIVHKIAGENSLDVDASILEKKAMQWEMAYNGMSPRTARQFIHWLRSEIEMEK